ncbi:MAG: hypothetical protein Q3M24_08815 [Candidatus Electrothrix aestuarii]|uniref:Uncharacterized protein n=1 Tax=Candidatus Electrothrix aestuarii TaxID=3062594 RepID=A0AAU8M142_9BACT|nr:hypothetical protein [Candidatus Electrothrix aestuarii]
MSTKRTLVKGMKFGLRAVNAVAGLATVIGVGSVAGAIGTAIGDPSVGKSFSAFSSKPIEEVFKNIDKSIDNIDKPF